MRRTLGVCVVLLLAVLAIPTAAEGQQRPRAQPTLGNHPNPFNPATTITFVLPDEFFANGRPAVVTIRIRNNLMEVVAVPEALNHESGDRRRVENLEYTTPGKHEAHWDGMDRFGNKVASGPYLLELVVNGERFRPRWIVVAK